jgi:hypothetical protein
MLECEVQNAQRRMHIGLREPAPERRALTPQTRALPEESPVRHVGVALTLRSSPLSISAFPDAAR